MKFGLWLAVAVAAFLWFNHAKRQRLKQRTPPAAQKHPAPTNVDPISEQIVACAHCGLHVPRSDAVITVDGAAVYCSEAHRRLHSPA